ncbi:hypothetical protein ACQ4LE_006216 [Meloidogyne hapla]
MDITGMLSTLVFDFELKSLRSMTAILVSYFEFFFLFWRFGLPLFLMLSFYSNVLSPLLARKVYLLLAGGSSSFFFFPLCWLGRFTFCWQGGVLLFFSPLLARRFILCWQRGGGFGRLCR